MNINIPHVTVNITIEKVVTESPAIERKLDEVQVALLHIKESLMAISAELQAILARIDAATNAIAAKIDALAAQVATDMSPEDVASLQASLGAEADKLEGIAANPTQPVPPASEPTP